MAEFEQVLLGRRSVRKYQDKDIPAPVLEKVLEAVMWSPSWANTQCWELVLVRDQETKEKLKETLAKGNPAGKAMLQAPVLAVLCGKKDSSGYYKDQVTTKHGDWLLFDLGIACQSLCLAAWNQGLGTVVIGLFDHDKVGEIVGMPQGYEVAVMLPLGYPDHEPKPPKRRPVAEFTHQETWGAK